MVGINGEKVSLGQANGPDVELIVTGTELYATYETPEGYPAIYDDRQGLFCFARLVEGKYESTSVPITANPPADVERHAQESTAVRSAKITERRSQLEQPRQTLTPPRAAPSKE
jgi:hypothetical protein